MGDNLTLEDRRRTMRAVKGKGTRPEKRLFSMLAQMGVRGWKKNVDSIIGKPDVAFVSLRIAIFVDGCFWHGCRHCKRKLPKTNQKYWKRKIRKNINLAKLYNRRLRADGWTVIRVWEHEINRMINTHILKTKILQTLKEKSKPN